jgi:FdhD protein
MRTPGHDEELVTGLPFNEGIISSASDIVSIGHLRTTREQAGGSVIAVELGKSGKAPTMDRLFYSNSS